MKKLILCGAIAASISGAAHAVNIKGEISPGYDSNPYRLSDNLDDGETWFVDTNVFANQKFGKFKLSGALKNRAHEGSFNNADVLTGKLKGRYKSKYKVMGKKFSSSTTIETGFKDKTYVSRTTGKIGTSSGQKIEDRYDYDYWKLSTSSSVWLHDQVKTSLALSYNNKSYDDQNIATLSNLDYEQANLLNTWLFKQNKDSDFKLAFGIGERDYDNRRQKTKAGALVAGSDLKYFYHNIKLSHQHDLTPSLSVDLGIKYEERTDNGFGYYDTDTIKYSANAFYTLDNEITLFAKTSYEDYEYNNAFTTDEDDEDLPGRQGYTIRLGAEKDLNELTGLPALGFIGVRLDDFDSNDPLYEYDRYQAFMGIKVSFKQ
ncbi:MAG: hypothetical protein V2J13_08410 [Cycloclasticus sp.]|jgi:hypothetical protein|nr:hypothetical protein [Cycloclasticus sp.]MEE4291752.1 hypothetical protein [Cycloclasticus sp.]